MYELGLRCGVLSFQGALLPHCIGKHPTRSLARFSSEAHLQGASPDAAVTTSARSPEQCLHSASWDRTGPHTRLCRPWSPRILCSNQAARRKASGSVFQRACSRGGHPQLGSNWWSLCWFLFLTFGKKKINLVLKTLYSKYKNAFVRWRCF